MNDTLPLFEDLEGPGARSTGGGAPDPGRRRLGEPTTPASDRHLREAWRLSRAMRRFPDHSPQQTRAGLAICRHLQALLGEPGCDRQR